MIEEFIGVCFVLLCAFGIYNGIVKNKQDRLIAEHRAKTAIDDVPE
jgi:hypothetical protein